jgi:hypothetical protein
VTKSTVREGRFKGEWVGLTCAACHNAQLNYKGTNVRVDGGVSNSLDIEAHIIALNEALAATAADGAKFEPLARRMNRLDRARTRELTEQMLVAGLPV